MARTKIRYYPSLKEYEKIFIEYFKENKSPLIRQVLNELHYETLEDLQKDEFGMKFAGDCGWVKLIPRNKEMYREWRLDNNDPCLFDIAYHAYNTQSITIKRIIVEKALEDLNLENTFYISERLD